MPDQNRPLELKMNPRAFILPISIFLITSGAIRAEVKNPSLNTGLLSPSSNEVWTNRLLRIPGMNREEIAKIKIANSKPYSSWLSYSISCEIEKSAPEEITSTEHKEAQAPVEKAKK